MTFDIGVVIPVGAGREQNLARTLDELNAQTHPPQHIVAVFDGVQLYDMQSAISVHRKEIHKHVPGDEQPRNIGVRILADLEPKVDWVLFLDSDIALEPTALEAYAKAVDANPAPRVLIGPYDWLPPDVRGVHPDGPFQLRDQRWDQFREFSPDQALGGEITGASPGDLSFLMGVGGACFSGNLVWPIEEFTRIGGFNPGMHHGRCEDGELGFRAIAHGIRISMVADARGYHQWHPVNTEWVLAANEQDVPFIHKTHPWLVDAGLVMTGKDGIRFDFRCPDCGERMNSLAYWKHRAGHS